MTKSSLTIVKFLTVGFARAFLILFSLFTNSTLTRFLRLSIDFPYTLFYMSLKKSFSNSEMAAFRFSVLNCIYDLSHGHCLNSSTRCIFVMTCPNSLYNFRFFMRVTYLVLWFRLGMRDD